MKPYRIYFECIIKLTVVFHCSLISVFKFLGLCLKEQWKVAKWVRLHLWQWVTIRHLSSAKTTLWFGHMENFGTAASISVILPWLPTTSTWRTHVYFGCFTRQSHFIYVFWVVCIGESKLFSCSPFGKGRKGRKRLRYLISLPSPPSSLSSIACKCYTIKLTIFLTLFLSPL